jgi:hypothetical protein
MTDNPSYVARNLDDLLEVLAEISLFSYDGIRSLSIGVHSFDLPVLRYRAMVNRVPAGGLEVRRCFHRYTGDALDLCDALGLRARS